MGGMDAKLMRAAGMRTELHSTAAERPCLRKSEKIEHRLRLISFQNPIFRNSALSLDRVDLLTRLVLIVRCKRQVYGTMIRRQATVDDGQICLLDLAVLELTLDDALGTA